MATLPFSVAERIFEYTTPTVVTQDYASKLNTAVNQIAVGPSVWYDIRSE